MYRRFKSRSRSAVPEQPATAAPLLRVLPSYSPDLIPPPSMRDRTQAEEGGQEADKREGNLVRRRSEELTRRDSALSSTSSQQGRQAGVWAGRDRNSTTSLVSRSASVDDNTIRGPPSLASSQEVLPLRRSSSRPRPPLARNASVPSSPAASSFVTSQLSPRDEFHGYDLSPIGHQPDALAQKTGQGNEAYAFPPQMSPPLSAGVVSPSEQQRSARPSNVPSQSSDQEHSRNFPDDDDHRHSRGETDSQESQDSDADAGDFEPVLLPSLLSNNPRDQDRDFDQRSSDLTTISEERSSRMSGPTRTDSVAGSSVAASRSSVGARSSTFSGAGWEAGGGGRQTMVSSMYAGPTHLRETPEEADEEAKPSEEPWRVGSSDAVGEDGRRETIFYSPIATPDAQTDRSSASSSAETPPIEGTHFPLPPGTQPSLEESRPTPTDVRKLTPAQAIAAQAREDSLRASSPMSALPPATAVAPAGDGDAKASQILAEGGHFVSAPSLSPVKTEDGSRSTSSALVDELRPSTPPRPALMVSPPSGDRLSPSHVRKSSFDRALPPLPPTLSAPNSETTIMTVKPAGTPSSGTTPPRAPPSSLPATAPKSPSSVLLASALLTTHAGTLNTTAADLSQRAKDLAAASDVMRQQGRHLSNSSLGSRSAKAEDDPAKLLEQSQVLHDAGREMLEESIRLSSQALDLMALRAEEARIRHEGEVRAWEQERTDRRKVRQKWDEETQAWEVERMKRERLREEEETDDQRRQSERSKTQARLVSMSGLDVPEDAVSLSVPGLRQDVRHQQHSSGSSSTPPPLTPTGLPAEDTARIHHGRGGSDTAPINSSSSPGGGSALGLSGTWRKNIKKIRRRISSESSSAGGGDEREGGLGVSDGAKVRRASGGMWAKVGSVKKKSS